jgi:hypothetical protein
MLAKLLESPGMPAAIVLLGPSLALVGASALVWLVWAASSSWLIGALARVA